MSAANSIRVAARGDVSRAGLTHQGAGHTAAEIVLFDVILIVVGKRVVVTKGLLGNQIRSYILKGRGGVADSRVVGYRSIPGAYDYPLLPGVHDGPEHGRAVSGNRIRLILLAVIPGGIINRPQRKRARRTAVKIVFLL